MPQSRSFAARLLAPAARRLAGSGVTPWMTTALACASGLAAAAAAAGHQGLVGAGLFVLSRAAFVLAAAGDDAPEASLGAGLEPVVLAFLPFGFALADPAHALAAAFLVLGLLAARVSALVCSAATGDARSAVGGVFDAAAFFGLLAACVLPDWFGLVAYGAGVIGFVAAGFALAATLTDGPA